MGNRDDLLAAAERCLRTRGYSGTTARDLCGEAGTSLAAIGYHFGSKEALLNEALGLAFEGWVQRLGAHVVEAWGGRAELVLAELVKELYVALEVDAPLLAAFFDAVAQTQHSPALRAQLARQYMDIRDAIRALTEAVAPHAAGGETGRAVASLMMAMVDGLAVQHLLDPAALPTPAAVGDVLGLIRVDGPAARDG